MTSNPDNPAPANEPRVPETIDMPAPTYWPLVLALGIALVIAGPITNLMFSAVGAVLLLLGVVNWAADLLPGAGHVPEELAAERPRPITGVPGRVAELRPGMPGHRLRLPEKIHPYSAGVRGGLVGAVLMGIPALLYGFFYQGSIWYPANLLAGMVIPGLIPADLPHAEELIYLREFHFLPLFLATVMHLLISMGLGLIYGVMLPTLPGSPLIWGGIVLPLLWTGGSYAFMGVINPVLGQFVSWPYFIASQFVFGIACAVVVTRSEKVYTQKPGE